MSLNVFSIYESVTTLIYSSTTYIPSIDPPDTDRKLKYSIFEGINGQSLVFGFKRSGKADNRLPAQFTLTFDIAPKQLVALFQNAATLFTTLKLEYDARWRSLQVTKKSSLVFTVSAGYGFLLDDCFWLLSDTDVTITTGHIKIYATGDIATGLLTIDSGASVPSGSIELATLSADELTSSTNGTQNHRYVKVINVQTELRPVNLTSLIVTVQEVFNAT